MSKNDGGPAFPCSCGPDGTILHGMSLRDWFAGRHQLLAHEIAYIEKYEHEARATIAASIKYENADAMIAQREEKP